MKKETRKKILKIFGIIFSVLGVGFFITGIVLITSLDPFGPVQPVFFIIPFPICIFGGIVCLVLGFNDPEKQKKKLIERSVKMQTEILQAQQVLVKKTCEYCGSIYDINDTKCPNCGASQRGKK